MATVTLALTACAPHGASAQLKDTSARARLDFATGEIILPLSEYDVLGSWSEMRTLQHAQELALGACMSEQGESYTAGDIVDDPDTNVGDRQYGLWDVDSVKKYGYFPPSSPSQAVVDKDAEEGGPKWQTALGYCQDHMPKSLRNLVPDNEETTSSIVPRLATEAFNSASADPAWQRAREKWWGCLRAAGLDPQTGADKWNTTQAEALITDTTPDGQVRDPEREIEVAYTEAKCNVDTGMAQSLGNLEAAYQKPLIVKNEAALDRVKDKKASRLAAAEKYIASHG